MFGHQGEPYWTSLTILVVIALPFGGAAVLWVATKLVKFREPSYARCFASISIGLGVVAVAWMFMLPVAPSLLESRRTFWIPPVVSWGTGVIASAIATPLLFRESLLKSVAAIGLTVGSALLLMFLVINYRP